MTTSVKPSLLIFYDYFSPAFKAGGPIRSLVNLTALLQDEFDIYVFTAAVDLDGAPLAVERDEWTKFGKNIKVFYASSRKLNIFFIHKVMLDLQPGVVYINGLFTPYSVLFPLLSLKFFRTSKGRNPRIVLASRGMLKESALALKAQKKKAYLKVFQLLGLHKEVIWHATDLQEEKNIRLFAEKKAEVRLIGNVPLLPKVAGKNGKKKGFLRLVSVSLIAKTKNLLFLIRILKQIKEGGGISYDIYGPVKDKDYWEIMDQEIKSLPSHIQVNYKGAIPPDQVSQILQQYDCFVLPTLGENFGHAIFEALGVGIPVLISDQTPWRNLQKEKAGWDLSLQEGLWSDKIIEISNSSCRRAVKFTSERIGPPALNAGLK